MTSLRIQLLLDHHGVEHLSATINQQDFLESIQQSKEVACLCLGIEARRPFGDRVGKLDGLNFVSSLQENGGRGGI